MNLLALRTLFTTFSGRYDLVVDTVDYANNGADFFIQGGQKLLESLVVTPKSQARSLKLVEQSEATVNLTNCQAVQEVWARARTAMTSGTLTVGQRYEIVARSIEDFVADGAADDVVGTQFTATGATVTLTTLDSVVRIDYDLDEEGYLMNPVDRTDLEVELGEDQSLVEEGEPFYYAVNVDRDIDVVESDPTVRGIVFGPPANGYYTFTIVGIFRFTLLDGDTDSNYWTDEHAVLLLYASLYTLESFYRNTAGMRDWMNAITTILFGVEADKVEEEIHNIDQMRG